MHFILCQFLFSSKIYKIIVNLWINNILFNGMVNIILHKSPVSQMPQQKNNEASLTPTGYLFKIFHQPFTVFLQMTIFYR